MRRSFVRRLAVLLLVLSTVVPAFAVPRQDDGLPVPARLIERILSVVKRVIVPLEELKSTVPIP